MKLSSFLNGSTEGRLPTVLFAFGLFLLLATPDWPDPAPAPVGALVSPLEAEPVAFDREGLGRDRAGALRFLGGWSLTSGDPRFGGISSLHVENGWATATSDAGSLIRFPIPGTAGAGRVRIDPIVQGPGRGTRKSDRDAEGMFLSGADAWVLFESPRQIWRYDRATWRAQASAAPRGMRRWTRAWGAEAIVRLADGRFLIFSEMASREPGLARAMLFGGDPALPTTPSAPVSYRAPVGFRATDAALLPDGRLLVLNRRFNWLEGVGAALMMIDPRAIRPGAVLEGREIARLQWPFVIDNMEGLSVTREGGRTIVWLVSDDNFNPVQRTLLLKFVLAE